MNLDSRYHVHPDRTDVPVASHASRERTVERFLIDAVVQLTLNRIITSTDASFLYEKISQWADGERRYFKERADND